MKQNQLISTDIFVKSPPSFDTIPEDVSLSVVKFIQGWAIEEGDEEQRERGRRARDSTLRAAALTSSRTFETYFTSLLQNVTLDAIHIFSFCQMLERGEPHYGALVRSIRFDRVANYEEQANLKLLTALGESFSTLPTTTGPSDRFWQGLEVAIGRCYRQLINLQSLVVLDHFVSFHQLHFQLGEKLKPHSFLDSSLKRLFIQLWVETSASFSSNLSAKNATWLFVFCRQIEEVALGLEMSVDDSKYLAEFAGTFAGLSPVKKLAIKINFVYEEKSKKTWWGLPEEQHGNHKGGNRKTESIINLLQSANQLDSLEIHAPFTGVRESDDSELSLDCLSTLSRSFTSLKHLRLMGSMFSLETGPLWLSCSFKALRVLTLDFRAFSTFSGIDVPDSLEVLCLPFYSMYPSATSEEGEGDYREDKLLSDLIDHKCQPMFNCLKEVVVPSRPIGVNGARTVSPQETQLWAQSRRELERASVIGTGKVKSRTVEVGESVGDALKGEVFWSTISWLSPPWAYHFSRRVRLSNRIPLLVVSPTGVPWLSYISRFKASSM